MELFVVKVLHGTYAEMVVVSDNVELLGSYCDGWETQDINLCTSKVNKSYQHPILLVAGEHITRDTVIDRFHFEYTTNGGDANDEGDTSIIQIQSASPVFSNNLVNNTDGWNLAWNSSIVLNGVNCKNKSKALIINNKINLTNFGDGDGWKFPYGILIESASEVDIVNNIILIFSTVSDGVYTHPSGIVLRTEANADIINNYISLTYTNDSGPTVGVEYFKNNLINCTTRVINNIFYLNTEAFTMVSLSNTSGINPFLEIRNNVFLNKIDTDYRATFRNLDGIPPADKKDLCNPTDIAALLTKSPTGAIIENNICNTDPTVIDSYVINPAHGTGDYHLESSSLARNAGYDVSASPINVTSDYEGNARPNESIVDIGAYEFY